MQSFEKVYNMTNLNSITHNVHEACGTDVERVQGDIDRHVYDYFFKHVICFTHGSRQALINFFFQRLYEECQDLKIPQVWDEENGAKIVEILNRLNFKEPKPDEPRKRSTSTRRTNTSSPVHREKSASKGNDHGATARTGEADAHHGAVPANPNVHAPTGVPHS